jgi:GntR family transcriptional regulator
MEDLLLRGRYKAGDRVPPEAELIDTLGVSRVTVRSGLARLVERGVLERHQGSGTFLVRPPEGSRLQSAWRGWRPTPFTPVGSGSSWAARTLR